MVAPLNWGLGHATRCIPIVDCLLNAGVEVVLAASGRSAELLKANFPQLELIDFPDYGMTHPVRGSFALRLVRKSGAVFRYIRNEHKVLKELVKEYRVDAVISDNRYGLHHPELPCVFITHQLFIRSPRPFRGWLRRIVRGFVKQYSECWVPDFEGDPNLSGKLAHGKSLQKNVRYIGPLSRFKKGCDPGVQKDIDYLAVISGPEPQRTHFEKLVTREFLNLSGNRVIVCGRTEKPEEENISGVRIVGHVDTGELESYFCRARWIVCRPGYSTLMDLYTLNKSATLVPTPGQTEQEYLAAHWSAHFPVQFQHELNFSETAESRPFPKRESCTLQSTVDDWLERIF